MKMRIPKKMPVPGRVYAGGTPFFNEGTGRRTDGIQSPPIMPIPGLPSGPFTPGEGGMSPGQLPTGGPFPGTGGVKPPRQDPRLEPIKQPPIKLPPIISDPMPPPPVNMEAPPPPMGPSDDLFGAPGSGSYDNLMSRAFQEYTSGQSPYAGAADFLMNRSVFDRGPRPETSMPSTDMPSYSYSDPGGAGGLAALQAQQPGLQAQYDQFAQQIQSAQEAAQQAAQEAAARQQEQTDLATSERQALMDRIAALEGREEPDLDAFGQQLRQDILGEVDLDALRREITGEVLQIAQAEFPDVMQIRDEVMRLLPEQEQIDVENLRRQIQEAIDTGAPEEQIVALRTELQNRIRPVEEQLQGLQESRGDVAEQIGELRGQVGALPDIDVEQLRQSIISQLPEQERVDIEALQRRIQESIDAGAPEEEIAGLRLELEQRLAPVEERVTTVRDQLARFRETFDPSSIREQIGNLRGRLEGINPVTGADLDFGEIARRVQEQLPQDRGVVPPDVLERLRAVEQREGPDLGSIREQIGELRGQLSQRPQDRGVVPPDLSEIRTQIAALENRGLPPEVLERLRAVEQREGPDEAAIAERVRSGLDPRIADLQQRFSEVDTSAQAMADRIAALREQQGQATEGRRGLSERLAALREQQGQAAEGRRGLSERLAALREQQGQAAEGRRGLSERLAALREQQGQAAQGRRELEDRLSGRLEEIRSGFNPLSERIAQLQGQFAERPNLTSDAVQEMIKASLANRTSAGIKPVRGGRG